MFRLAQWWLFSEFWMTFSISGDIIQLVWHSDLLRASVFAPAPRRFLARAIFIALRRFLFDVSKTSIMTDQPEIATAYQDEWGEVAPEVYQAVVSLREQAERYARTTLGAEDAGRTLMAKAAAIVTRALDDRGEQITNLQAYLFQTYKRLVQAELEKTRTREKILAERAEEVSQNGHSVSDELDQYILIEELRRRMNQRTRQVFDLLALGHTFEEIGAMMGKSGRAIRNNYYEQVARLKEELS
jgi:DNA-directed RNA polymerase specialized sigma24 family protein